MCEEISCHFEFMSKNQDEPDQGTFRDESFIQNSSWFSAKSEERANFYLVYETPAPSRIHHA